MPPYHHPTPPTHPPTHRQEVAVVHELAAGAQRGIDHPGVVAEAIVGQLAGLGSEVRGAGDERRDVALLQPALRARMWESVCVWVGWG